MTTIARSHKVVLCDDKQAACCQSSTVSHRYINIKGAEHLVHEAVTEIQEKYAQSKRRMDQKNSGVVNEMELWHGSKTNAEHIYDSEEGFDMRFSSDGMWGRANYFAAEAKYSVKYAFQRDDGTKELLLAKVLTGDSFDSPPNRKLTMPPEKTTPTSYLATSDESFTCQKVHFFLMFITFIFNYFIHDTAGKIISYKRR